MNSRVEIKGEKSAIRRERRRIRKSLTADDRAAADAAIRRHTMHLAAFRRARNVATYFAFDGEPDIALLLSAKSNGAKNFFAPIITRRDMRFGKVGAGTRMRKNWFGIAEARPEYIAEPQALDIVLVPLVAFDRVGSRLGMGGGYYDRYFKFLKDRTHFIRPKLFGIAYSCQQVELLPREHWDVPLWGVITEKGVCRVGGL
jgi:5-formyltetrahydrofolate cyclo-ligase